MHSPKVIFTETDRAILRSYSSLLDGMAEYLGEAYELVLHSLEDLDHSAVKVINGRHTGRRQGAPITEFALSMLEKINRQSADDYICYRAKNKNGDPLWSTTIAIRGEGNKVIGLLCANFSLDTPLYRLFGNIIQPAPPAGPAQETYADNVGDMVKNAVVQAAGQAEHDDAILPSMKNKEIVALLYARGIFNMKDAVNLVAGAMGISRNTVYLHLRHIKRSQSASPCG